MQAVDEKRVDQIVVYKIDRLKRPLTDFAKLVDQLDAAETSFISVTQSSNTATSMGRLTLNMLLSFAQFEREVTAVRIRDKKQAYEGQHSAVIGPAVWDKVQDMLQSGAAVARGSRQKSDQITSGGQALR